LNIVPRPARLVIISTPRNELIYLDLGHGAVRRIIERGLGYILVVVLADYYYWKALGTSSIST